MGQLVFNFFKRSLLYPALVAGILVAVIVHYGSAQVTASQNKLTPAAPAPFSLAGYTETEYTAFSQLEPGNLAATILCENAGLTERAVCYDAGTAAISLEPGSTEPWNSGALLMTGTNAQLRMLYGVTVGDTIVMNFRSNGEYRYAVKQIVTGLHRGDLADYAANNILCLAAPYNDLSAAAQPSLYILFIAEQI